MDMVCIPQHSYVGALATLGAMGLLKNGLTGHYYWYSSVFGSLYKQPQWKAIHLDGPSQSELLKELVTCCFNFPPAQWGASQPLFFTDEPGVS